MLENPGWTCHAVGSYKYGLFCFESSALVAFIVFFFCLVLEYENNVFLGTKNMSLKQCKVEHVGSTQDV